MYLISELRTGFSHSSFNFSSLLEKDCLSSND